MSDIEIETGVPVPDKKAKASSKWKEVVSKMKIGDSVHPVTLNEKAIIWKIAKDLGFGTASRRTGKDTYRVWKVEQKEPKERKKKENRFIRPLPWIFSEAKMEYVSGPHPNQFYVIKGLDEKTEGYPWALRIDGGDKIYANTLEEAKGLAQSHWENFLTPFLK